MWLVDGLPVHPLIVHLPLVAIPLIGVGLFVYVVVPSWRRPLGMILLALAVASAAGASLAAWSGDQLGDAMQRGVELTAHRTLGERTRAYALVLAAATLALVLYERRNGRPNTRVVGAAAAVAVIAVGSTAAVALTGHSGAQLAWADEMAAATRASGAASVTASATSATTTPTVTATVEPIDVRAPAAVARSARAVEVVLGEWAVVMSVDEAPPGPVTFRIKNRGAVAHALRIRTPGSGKNRSEWRSATIAPGAEGTLTADLPAGSYEIDCPVEDGHGEHDALGMEALFTVRVGVPPVSDRATTSPAAPTTPSSATVDIAGFAFAPNDLHIRAGDSVTWTNTDPAPHTATGSGWDTGRLEQNGRGSVTFATPGTVSYICAIHPAMTGTVTVAA